MNSVGIKPNRFAQQVGLKTPQSMLTMGNKMVSGDRSASTAKAKTDINQHDSTVLETENMPIIPANRPVHNKNALERRKKRNL